VQEYPCAWLARQPDGRLALCPIIVRARSVDEARGKALRAGEQGASRLKLGIVSVAVGLPGWVDPDQPIDTSTR
jgi:hypothetical protein